MERIQYRERGEYDVHTCDEVCLSQIRVQSKKKYVSDFFFFSFFLFYSFSSNAYQPGLNAYESGGSEQKVPDPNQV